MTRPTLLTEKIHPAIRDRIAGYQSDLVQEVTQAIAENDVVIVGMRQNPHPRRARKLLEGKGLAFKYLEYGSYMSQWRRRLALKIWTGWTTFPMVFVKGVLVGGADELDRLASSGELDKMLAG